MERAVLDQLAEYFRTRLSGYPTTLSEDDSLVSFQFPCYWMTNLIKGIVGCLLMCICYASWQILVWIRRSELPHNLSGWKRKLSVRACRWLWIWLASYLIILYPHAQLHMLLYWNNRHVVPFPYMCGAYLYLHHIHRSISSLLFCCYNHFLKTFKYFYFLIVF